MSKSWMTPVMAVLVSALVAAPAAGQAEPVFVQPGAPGEPSRGLSSEEMEEAAPDHPHTEADVRFMRGMIPHHNQAIEMVALVADRTDNPAVRLLAERIRISQRDEIILMEEWLVARGETPSDDGAAHHHHPAGGDQHALMPGMLTDAEMAELAMATGAAFDRLFLASMIRHHEGALVMVRDLFASEGGGHELEICRPVPAALPLSNTEGAAVEECDLDRIRAVREVEHRHPAARIAHARTELDRVERLAPGPQRTAALAELAAALTRDAGGAADADRVRLLVDSVRDLAGAGD